MTINITPKEIFFSFFIILFSFFEGQTSSVFERSDSVLSIGKAEEAKMRLLETFLDLKSLRSKESPQGALYARLLKVRNGKADHRVKRTDIATYITLMTFFGDIVSPEESLDQRATLNRANALVSLADLASHDMEKRHLYYEAYYLYTLLSNTADRPNIKEAAHNNAQKLLKTEKIITRARKELKKAVMPKSEELIPLVNSAVKSQLDDIEAMRQPLLDTVLELVLGGLQEKGIKLTEEMRSEIRLGMQEESQKEDPDLLKLRKREEKDLANQVISAIGSRTPGMREKEIALTKPVPMIMLKDSHLEAMTHLLGQVYLTVKRTPLLRGRMPVVIPVGRSVSWLVKLHEMLEPTCKIDIEFRHILASGLQNLEPTTPQKLGYKKYLDSLGFDKLEKDNNVELIFLDVAESGQTLMSIKSFVEELYPGLENHTQHFAISYGEQTTDLPCARIGYMPHALRPVMFAKHNEKQHYCPHPPFYPHDWENPEMIGEFVVPKGALEWEEKMQTWVKGQGAVASCREIQELL